MNVVHSPVGKPTDVTWISESHTDGHGVDIAWNVPELHLEHRLDKAAKSLDQAVNIARALNRLGTVV